MVSKSCINASTFSSWDIWIDTLVSLDSTSKGEVIWDSCKWLDGLLDVRENIRDQGEGFEDALIDIGPVFEDSTGFPGLRLFFGKIFFESILSQFRLPSQSKTVENPGDEDNNALSPKESSDGSLFLVPAWYGEDRPVVDSLLLWTKLITPGITIFPWTRTLLPLLDTLFTSGICDGSEAAAWSKILPVSLVWVDPPLNPKL